jgi:spore coat polysaccharide biosynthesis predicted glycosyltransferase SpsG
MTRPASAVLRVLFRVAAGPRVGFGHLVRCRSLARAMGVEPLVSVRGSAATRRAAAAMGLTVVHDVRQMCGASVVVVDDPSAECAAEWVRRAKRAGLPAATVQDLGLGRVAAADLIIDGSIDVGLRHQLDSAVGPRHLLGTRYAILDPAVLAARQQRRRPVPFHVLIALGGGAQVRTLAGGIARAIAEREPMARVFAASGFTATRRPELPRGHWIDAPDGLAPHLSRADVAIVAGGVTLYEACALGVPAIAVAVAAAQRLTIRGFARMGAVVDAGGTPIDASTVGRIADGAVRLLHDGGARRRLSLAGRSVVDARGAWRVGARLHHLARGAWSDAA